MINLVKSIQMKVILSRKGFDSRYGSQPSPILPDGTLLSLPIPAKDELIKFSDLTYEGNSFLDIIKSLYYTMVWFQAFHSAALNCCAFLLFLFMSHLT